MPIRIDRLREDLRAASGQWAAGVNHFTSMTAVERRAHLTYKPGADELSLKRREGVARLTRLHRDTVPPLRAAIDLRSHQGHSFVPAVGKRTHAGMARTIASVVTSSVRLLRHQPLLEIEMPALDAERMAGRAWLAEPLGNLVVPVHELGMPRGEVAVVRWHELHTRSAMKHWLATRGALVAVFAVHEDFFAYARGVYHYISGSLDGGHCVAVVGYDDTQELWLAQNTWGTAWGERGCFRIAFGERGIDASMWGVELRLLDG
jgi:hypothetical protein